MTHTQVIIMPRAANSVDDNTFMLAQIAILLCVCMFLGAGPWLTIFACIYWYNRVKEYIHDTDIILMMEEEDHHCGQCVLPRETGWDSPSNWINIKALPVPRASMAVLCE
jgi:hypothetical protein